jgi:hypothetical protein
MDMLHVFDQNRILSNDTGIAVSLKTSANESIHQKFCNRLLNLPPLFFNVESVAVISTTFG